MKTRRVVPKLCFLQRRDARKWVSQRISYHFADCIVNFNIVWIYERRKYDYSVLVFIDWQIIIMLKSTMFYVEISFSFYLL